MSNRTATLVITITEAAPLNYRLTVSKNNQELRTIKDAKPLAELIIDVVQTLKACPREEGYITSFTLE